MSRATERYDISTRLAVGDAAFVYKATDLASGRTVALKLLLREEQIAHPLDAESLLSDAPAISQITGVNIVQLLDAFRDDDGTVLVYEFADGTRGLDVPGKCPISAEHAVDVAAQLLGALRSGERQRYPHGGLKPSDISLVQLPDGRPLLMVLDWGLANYRRDLTPGALAFTAPERLAGEAPSHGADLFSAGAVLTYLLTGRQLVGGTTKEEVAAAWKSVNPAAIGAFRPDLPEALVQWITHLLQPNPERRPTSAVEALTTLSALNPPLPPVVPESIRPRPARPQTQPATQAAVTAPAALLSEISKDTVLEELGKIRRGKQTLTVVTTYAVMLVTLGTGAFVWWSQAQVAKERDIAASPAASTPAPQLSLPAVPDKSTPAQPPAEPVLEPVKTPKRVTAIGRRAGFSSNANPPVADIADIANLVAQTGSDKWFFESGDERYGADAAKGLTFTTGNVPMLFKALTYKIATGAKKAATPANPTTWAIRLGTVSGNRFTQIASEQMDQTADTGEGHYVTWTFSTPITLAADTTYAVDVAMRSGTPWKTGIPYLAISKSSNGTGVGIAYSSGDRGVGGDTIAPAGGVSRIFHLDLEVR